MAEKHEVFRETFKATIAQALFWPWSFDGQGSTPKPQGRL